MIFSASAISTTFKKVSLTTAGIAAVMALGTAGASAVTLTSTIIDTTVGVGALRTVEGLFSGSDTITLNASGTVDNLEASGPDGYTTNAAGIVTASSIGSTPGTVSPSGFGTFNSGALLIGNTTIGFKQAFASISANGLGNSAPIANLTRTTTLASIFGSGFTTTGFLQFKIEPYNSGGGTNVVVNSRGNLISSVPSLASVPNVYTLTGTISQAGTPATDVPEPLTIVGTLIGGTAALRMRKKLKANNN
jgi:hypothetical protein